MERDRDYKENRRGADKRRPEMCAGTYRQAISALIEGETREGLPSPRPGTRPKQFQGIDATNRPGRKLLPGCSHATETQGAHTRACVQSIAEDWASTPRRSRRAPEASDRPRQVMYHNCFF